MSTAREIYDTYQVPPWLQEHQVRVAAVGKIIAEAYVKPIDTSLVVTTCLLHDVGAIVKFDFRETLLADLVNPGDVSHWERVQAQMREHYGVGEYGATDAILIELGAEREREVFKQTGLTRLGDTLREGTYEARVVQYADTRVGPRGVMSVEERMKDARVRYAGKGLKWFERLDEYHMLNLDLEKMVLADTTIDSGSITDATIAPVMEQLWDYEIA